MYTNNYTFFTAQEAPRVNEVKTYGVFTFEVMFLNEKLYKTEGKMHSSSRAFFQLDLKMSPRL